MAICGAQIPSLEFLPVNVLQSKPLAPSVRGSVFSRPQLLDCLLLTEVFRLDSVAEAHKKGKFHEPENRRRVEGWTVTISILVFSTFQFSPRSTVRSDT